MPIIKRVLLDCAKLCNLSYLSQDDMTSRYETNRPYLQTDECSVFYKCDNNIPKLICSKQPEDGSQGNNDCQVYTTRYLKDNKHILVVAFRGTESGRDILTDLNIFTTIFDLPNYSTYYTPIFHQEQIQSSNNPIAIHAGFNNQFNAVRDELDSNIENFINNHFINNSNNSNNKDTIIEPEIIFTGHSLGGALATIGSLYYKYKYPEITVSCITFGSPRVGSKQFVDIFNNKIDNSYRFVNDNDPVPCIPTAWRFMHVKGCQWLYQDKVMNEISVNSMWRFIKNSILNLLGVGGYNASGDHSCNGYMHDLQLLGYDIDE